MAQQQENMSGERRSAVLYLRVASADPRDQRLGVARQRAACLCAAERLDARVVGEYADGELAGSMR